MQNPIRHHYRNFVLGKTTLKTKLKNKHYCLFSISGFWDPEKYFDLMRLAKAAKHLHTNDQNTILMSGDSTKMQKSVTNQRKTNFTNKKPSEEQISVCETTEEPPITGISFSKCLNLNPGSTYEVNFCSINPENNFYVNTISLMCALNELTLKINEYCNHQQQMYIKANIDDILLAKSITDCVWYRARLIGSTGMYRQISQKHLKKTFLLHRLMFNCIRTGQR
jgi:hypothetical protein